jgi:hypothetical protein
MHLYYFKYRVVFFHSTIQQIMYFIFFTLNVIGVFIAWLIIKTISTFLFHIIFIFPINYFLGSTADVSIIMLHNKQKVISGILMILVVTLMLGCSSYSYVFAPPLQPANHHHKVFDKKQDSGTSSKDASNGGDGDSSDNSGGYSSSSGKTLGHTDDSSSDSSRGSSTSDIRSSDSSNNLDNSDNKNNDHSTNDVGNTGENQGSRENVSLTGTNTPTPQTTCEQGSNCTDQQGLGDRDRFTTATTARKQDNNTPFILSLPFP